MQQEDLSEYVLESKDVLVFPLSLQELELLNQNPVAFSAYINVWYDGDDFNSPVMQKAYQEQIKLLKDNESDWIWHTFWMIVSIKERTIVGSICFKNSPKNGSCEIGYGINPKYANRGITSKAVALICEWACTQGLKSLLATTELDNIASSKVLTKNGFVQTKKMAKLIYYKKDFNQRESV